MNTENISMNPFKSFLGDWALVSAGNEEKSNTMTIGWGALGGMWGVDAAFVVIRYSRYTKEFVDANDYFSVAFFDGECKDALMTCGRTSGRDTDKWAASGLTPTYANGVPYPAEAKRVFICRKMAAMDMPRESFIDDTIYDKWYSDDDMHVMYIGEVVDVIEK